MILCVQVDMFQDLEFNFPDRKICVRIEILEKYDQDWLCLGLFVFLFGCGFFFYLVVWVFLITFS